MENFEEIPPDEPVSVMEQNDQLLPEIVNHGRHPSIPVDSSLFLMHQLSAIVVQLKGLFFCLFNIGRFFFHLVKNFLWISSDD